MRYRTFGRTGWRVGEVGYGMWGMGGWSGSDDTESLGSLELAATNGVNFFDTAQAYGDGHSERLLARLVAGQPDRRIRTATKVPPKNRKWPSRPDVPLAEVFPRDYVREYVAISRTNLGVESSRACASRGTWRPTPRRATLGRCRPTCSPSCGVTAGIASRPGGRSRNSPLGFASGRPVDSSTYACAISRARRRRTAGRMPPWR